MQLIAAIAAATAVSAAQVPNPRVMNGWVADMPDSVPAAVEQQIATELANLHQETGIEVVIAVVGDVNEDPDVFATKLLDAWDVGSDVRDDGIVILLVMDRRELVIRTGADIRPRITDSWLTRMQETTMFPWFKKGDTGRGLLEGVKMIGAQVRGQTTGAASGARSPGEKLLGFAMLLTVPFVGIAGFAGKLYYDKLRRTCATCRVEMAMLDEIADDAHLTEAQRTEERLGSVDWQVFVCGGCGGTKQIAKTKWFSGYSPCGSCKARAMKTTSRTLVHATYTSGGQVEVTERCAHCKNVRTFVRHTPRRTPPSSSSSGSRSSGSSSSSSRGGSRGKW